MLQTLSESSGHASVGEAAQPAFPSPVFKVTVPKALADTGEGAGTPQSLAHCSWVTETEEKRRGNGSAGCASM